MSTAGRAPPPAVLPMVKPARPGAGPWADWGVAVAEDADARRDGWDRPARDPRRQVVYRQPRGGPPAYSDRATHMGCHTNDNILHKDTHTHTHTHTQSHTHRHTHTHTHTHIHSDTWSVDRISASEAACAHYSFRKSFACGVQVVCMVCRWFAWFGSVRLYTRQNTFEGPCSAWFARPMERR